MTYAQCYNDLAARNYAHEETMWEQRLDAIADRAVEVESWSVDQLRSKLSPHQQEVIDEIVNGVAEKLLDQWAKDNERDEPLDAWD